MKRYIAILFLSILALTFVAPMNEPAEAQRPDAPLFAQRGPFSVGTQELHIEDAERPLDVTVWYPAENPDELEENYTYQYFILAIEGHALIDAPIRIGDAPYPLIVFSHGSGGLRYQSTFLTEHFASYGFVVMAVDHVGNTILERQPNADLTDFLVLRPQDVLRQIEYAETINASVFSEMIDIDHIAIVGHSFGGYTSLVNGGAQLNTPAIRETLPVINNNDEILNRLAELQNLEIIPEGLWPAMTDDRIQAIIPMAPAIYQAFGAEGIASIDVPTMIMVGSTDSVTPAAQNASPIFDALDTTPKAYVEFENADHYIFALNCPDALRETEFFPLCSDPVWDMERAHDLINHFAIAFLRSVFYDDVAALEALQPTNVDFVGIDYQFETE